jgi:hypothetical protein
MRDDELFAPNFGQSSFEPTPKTRSVISPQPTPITSASSSNSSTRSVTSMPDLSSLAHRTVVNPQPDEHSDAAMLAELDQMERERDRGTKKGEHARIVVILFLF